MSAISIDDEWKSFCSNEQDFISNSDIVQENTSETKIIPESSALYISTKTMIAFLDLNECMIDINNLFWYIQTIPYYKNESGIIKKQMKFTCLSKHDDDKIDLRLKHENVFTKELLSSTTEKSGYKNIQKISIGLSKKDIICYRMKPKSVFYNCFALVIRIEHNSEFKDVHLKLFNTGKMEIPGIQNNEILFKCLDVIVNTLRTLNIKQFILPDSTRTYSSTELIYKPQVDTVLINSNFNCGYYVKRDVMFNILRNEYNIITLFDPCSYPGVQSKFYYNSNKPIQNGRCECGEKKCNKKQLRSCREISFMIFRTGSVLIVGNCDEMIINHIYRFLTSVFVKHFNELNDGVTLDKKPNQKHKRKIKKSVIMTSEYYEQITV